MSSHATYRVPLAEPSSLSGDQKKLHDEYYAFAEKSFGENGTLFRWKDPSTNALIGPYPAFLSLPGPSKLMLDAVVELGSVCNLPPATREIGILVVASHYQGGFAVYSHKNIAKKLTELSDEQADKLANGEKPEDLSAEQEVAYDIAKRLTAVPGPLPKVLWEAGVEAFGKEGILALITYVGFYAYVSILLNGADAPVPE